MPRATLASPFSLLRCAWQYFRKHSALQSILIWFFILPEALQVVLNPTTTPPALVLAAHHQWELSEFLGVLASIALSIIVLWGSACVLLIGKRMIQNKAGRSRTSFRSVRKDALPLIIPLFFTSLLQLCLLFYRSLLYFVPAIALFILLASGYHTSIISIHNLPNLLLILTPLLIPTILYYCRTFFFSIALVSEDVTYRSALRRSSELVTGKIMPLSWRVITLSLCTIIPGSILSSIIEHNLVTSSPVVLLLSVLLRSSIVSLASLLFLLTTVALYGSLRNLREVPRK